MPMTVLEPAAICVRPASRTMLTTRPRELACEAKCKLSQHNTARSGSTTLTFWHVYHLGKKKGHFYVTITSANVDHFKYSSVLNSERVCGGKLVHYCRSYRKINGLLFWDTVYMATLWNKCYAWQRLTQTIFTATTIWMKKALTETLTLHAGCSKAEPNIFTLPQTPLPGTQDRQNLISWRWSLPLPTNPVWWRLMHAISNYRGNRPTNTHKDRTDYNTLRR